MQCKNIFMINKIVQFYVSTVRIKLLLTSVIVHLYCFLNLNAFLTLELHGYAWGHRLQTAKFTFFKHILY